jgi:hypothetical protein
VLRGATLLLLLPLLLAVTACGSSSSKQPTAGLPVVVLQSPSAAAWVRLLRSAGYAAHDGDLASVLARASAVVPADAELSGHDVSRVADWVRKGGRLATANDALLHDLGVTRGTAATMSGVTMERSLASWAGPQSVRPLNGAGLQPVARSQEGRVLMATATKGAGALVAFAIDPAGHGRAGFELMPHAASWTAAYLHAPTGPRSFGAAVFVDPGGLPANERDPARIAELLKRGGARVAEIAGWNYDFNDPAQDYDYAALLNALHARGILAYLWLEPPFITLRLWQDHPECREKTQTGRDAMVDWRSLIALEDPACFALATESWTRVVTKFPWDGVNVAELYFEPNIKAANYTPFSRAALEQFGGDPAKNPAGFERFRTDLVTSLNRRVLSFLNGLPNARRRALELTVIDDTLDPVQGKAVGSDVRQLATVATKAGAGLIVEDPFTTWTDGPLRYDKLGPHVRALMPVGAAQLDVNVVDRAGARPTAKMTGAELSLALGSAAAPLGSVALYSLGTLTAQDLAAVPGALGSSVATTDLGVYGSQTVQVTSPLPGRRSLTVDSIPWPAANGTAIVPPGNHVLNWWSDPPTGPGLASFTGELGTARVAARTLEFTYVTRPEALAVVTRRPRSLRLDGKPAPLVAQADPDGGTVVRLPRGRHVALLRF